VVLVRVTAGVRPLGSQFEVRNAVGGTSIPNPRQFSSFFFVRHVQLQ